MLDYPWIINLNKKIFFEQTDFWTPLILDILQKIWYLSVKIV
jgi:hypothetical protein